MDSLINFETVKLYGNEEHELKRYDRCLAGTILKFHLHSSIGLDCSFIY